MLAVIFCALTAWSILMYRAFSYDGKRHPFAGYGHGEIIAHPDVMAEEIRRFLAK